MTEHERQDILRKQREQKEKAEAAHKIQQQKQAAMQLQAQLLSNSPSPLKGWRPTSKFSALNDSISGAAMPTLAEIVSSGGKGGMKEVQAAREVVEEAEEAEEIAVVGGGGDLSEDTLELYGKLVGELSTNSVLVFAVASAIANNTKACTNFIKIMVRRVSCRFTSNAVDMVRGVLECARKVVVREAERGYGEEEVGDEGARAVVVLNLVALEVCNLDEVKYFARDMVGEEGGEDGGGEGRALSIIKRVLKVVERDGVSGIPNVLLMLLQTIEGLRGFGATTAEQVFCELVLLKGLRESGGIGGEGVGEFVQSFLKMVVEGTVGGREGGMSILQMAPLAYLQVKFQVWFRTLLAGGRGGQGGLGGGGEGSLHFDSSFGERGKPREMVGVVVVKKADLYVLVTSVDTYLGGRGRRGGGVGVDKRLVGLVSKLEGVDGVKGLRGNEEAVLVGGGGGGGGEGGDVSETALEGATFMLQMGWSKLKVVLQDKEGGLMGADVIGMKEVIGQLRENEGVIKVMLCEADRLETALVLERCYQRSLKCLEEERGGRGGGGGDLCLEEKGLLKVLEGGVVGEGEADGGQQGGEASKSGDVYVPSGDVYVPSSPLATLMSTLFNPANLV